MLTVFVTLVTSPINQCSREREIVTNVSNKQSNNTNCIAEYHASVRVRGLQELCSTLVPSDTEAFLSENASAS